MKKNLHSISGKWNFILNLLYGTYSIICIIPVLLVVIVSLTDENCINMDGYSFFPAKLSTKAYDFIFRNSGTMLRAYGVTIFTTVVGCVLSVLIIAAYAYPISRKDFRYKKQFTFMVFFPILFSGGLVPWFLVCTQLLHLKNSIWALIVPCLMNGFFVLVMRTFYTTTIPDSIIESAKIDGAGELRIFASMVLPLSKPGIATIGLFCTMGFWNDFFLPLMFIDDNKWVNLQFALYKMQSNIEYLTRMSAANGNVTAAVADMPSESARMAMCVCAMGPIILVYPFFQKHFTKGLVLGAVKG